jgi:hypothetical protein
VVWGGLWEFPGGDLVDGRPEEAIVHHYTRYKIILQAFSCKTLQRRNPRVSLRSDID